MASDDATVDDGPRRAIMEAATAAVRRFGAERTRVTDIARAIGVSHSALYRYFPSRTEMFAAVVQQTMNDEVDLAREFVGSDGPASTRMRNMIIELHRRKRARFVDDCEVHDLYRLVSIEHITLVADYSRRMTALIEQIIAQGVRAGEFSACDIGRVAGGVRDAVTAFIHPAIIETIALDPAGAEMRLNDVLNLVVAGLRAGSAVR